MNAAASTNEERTWALAAHLSILLLYLGIGFGLSWVAPLVIWMVKKDDSVFVEDQAREALNFQLAVWIVSVLCAVTVCLLPVSLVVLVGATVYGIIAAVAANKGELYRYPYTFRLIKE